MGTTARYQSSAAGGGIAPLDSYTKAAPPWVVPGLFHDWLSLRWFSAASLLRRPAPGSHGVPEAAAALLLNHSGAFSLGEIESLHDLHQCSSHLLQLAKQLLID